MCYFQTLTNSHVEMYWYIQSTSNVNTGYYKLLLVAKFYKDSALAHVFKL